MGFLCVYTHVYIYIYSYTIFVFKERGRAAFHCMFFKQMSEVFSYDPVETM